MRASLKFTVPLVAALMLAACAPVGPGVDEIVAVDFEQSQAVPDFDTAEYTQDDPAEIEKLIDLLAEYDVDPAGWRGQDTTGCTGNRVTRATIRYAGSDLATQLRVDSCSDDPFEEAADELFSDWRRALAGG